MKSSVKFPQSVMIWGAMSSAGVGPLCFLKTNVTAPVYQEILEHFMLPSADLGFASDMLYFSSYCLSLYINYKKEHQKPISPSMLNLLFQNNNNTFKKHLH